MLTVKRKSSKLLCMLADIAVDLLRPKEMEKKKKKRIIGTKYKELLFFTNSLTIGFCPILPLALYMNQETSIRRPH